MTPPHAVGAYARGMFVPRRQAGSAARWVGTSTERSIEMLMNEYAENGDRRAGRSEGIRMQHWWSAG